MRLSIAESDRIATSQQSKGNPDSSRVKCPTVLISDLPALTDSWGMDGPHRRVARAIADLLRSETGGVSIGLEGSWGSGKTTVINLLREELKTTSELAIRKASKSNQETYEVDHDTQATTTSKKYALIPFDAWAHEKDPLRRTFLENLIINLKDLDWVNRAEWEKRLDIIGQRLEEKSTKSFPQLKAWGIVVGASFLLVSFGHALLTAALREEGLKLTIDPNLNIAWKFIIGMSLTIAPLLMLIGVGVTSAIITVWKQLKNKYWKTSNALPEVDEANEDVAPSMWAMLFNRVITSEYTKTFKTPNPTSIEFESEFKRLMKEALEGNTDTTESNHTKKGRQTKQEDEEIKERHVVLVLDNLDRVDASDALSIWSTLQTFLRYTHHEAPSWFERFWIIVLYDPRGIRLLWESDKKETPYREQTSEAAFSRDAFEGNGKIESAHAAEDTISIAAKAATSMGQQIETARASQDTTALSFLDKSFQIRFEVPPPVLSDWRSRLLEFLEQALPARKHRNEDHIVHNVLAIYFAQQSQLPTIRELKLIVNQIGAVHRQWAVSYLPSDQSPDGLREFPLSHIAYYVLLRRRGLNIVKGLRDGIFPEEEFKDILGGEVRDTLAALIFNTDIRKAREIVLGDPIEKALLRADGDQLTHLANNHEGFWDILQRVISTSWFRTDPTWISNAALGINKSGLLASEKHPMAESIVRTLCGNASRVKAWPSFDLRKAESIGILYKWQQTWHIEVTKDSSITTFELDIFRSISSSLIPNIQGMPPPASVQIWYEGLIFVSKEIEQYENANKYIVDGVVVPIASELLPDREGKLPSITGMRLKTLIEALFRLSELKLQKVDDVFNSLVFDGYILQHLKNINTETDSVAAAWCLFTFLQRNPQVNKDSAIFGLDGYTSLRHHFEKPIEEVVRQFTYLLISHKELPLLFQVLDHVPDSKAFVAECLKQAADDEDALDLLTPEIIVAHWTFLFDVLNEQTFQEALNGEYLSLTPKLRAFLTILLKESEQVNTSHEKGLVEFITIGKFDPKLASLYAAIAILLVDPIKKRTFQEWCFDSLQPLTSDEWLDQLLGGGDLYELIISLYMSGYTTHFKAYQYAVVDYAKAMLEGNIKAGLRVSPLLPLDITEEETIRNKIYELAANANGDIPEYFFDVFSDVLSDMSLLSKESGTRIFSPLVRKRNIRGLNWIREFIAINPMFLKPQSQNDIEGLFKNELEAALSKQLDDEAAPIILHISQSLGINAETDTSAD